MDLHRLLMAGLPPLALAVMLSGMPRAFGHTGSVHIASSLTLRDVANWMYRGMTIAAEIEAHGAVTRGAEIGLSIPTD